MSRTHGGGGPGRGKPLSRSLPALFGLLVATVMCLLAVYSGRASTRQGGKLGGAPSPLPVVEPASRAPEFTETRHLCHSRDFSRDGTAERQGGMRASCLFRNICAAPSPPGEGNPNEQFIGINWYYLTRDVTDVDDVSFTLGIGPHSTDARLLVKPAIVTPEQFNEKFPQVERSNNLSVAYYEFNAENFGHMLMDLVLPVYAGLDNMGRLTRDVHLLKVTDRHRDGIGWNCDFLSKSGHKYGIVAGPEKRCARMYRMFMPMVTQHPVRLLSDLAQDPAVPVCFSELLVGLSMNSDDCLDGWHGRNPWLWSLCNHNRQGQFWRFRGDTMAALGASQALPQRHRIVVTLRSDKGTHIQQRMPSNQQEIRAAVKATFAGQVEVVEVEWMNLTLVEQIELAASATVLITPAGGVSFIGVYLPRGATMVRLYTRDYPMEFHIFNYLGYTYSEYLKSPLLPAEVERVNEQTVQGVIPAPAVLQAVARGLQRFDAFAPAARARSWQPFHRTAALDEATRDLRLTPKHRTPLPAGRQQGTRGPEVRGGSAGTREEARPHAMQVKEGSQGGAESSPVVNTSAAYNDDWNSTIESICQTFWYDPYYQQPDAAEKCAAEARATRQELATSGINLSFGVLPTDEKQGTGVVFTIADGNQLALILRSIVRIWEMNTGYQVEVHSEAAGVIDVCEAFRVKTDQGQHRGMIACVYNTIQLVPAARYAYKALAILQSRFRHVLFLDADSTPVTPLDPLFSSPQYAASGAIFWPDLWGYRCRFLRWGGNDPYALCGQSAWPEHVMWRVLGVEWKEKRQFAQEMESGQMIVDSVRHHKALVRSLQLASHPWVMKVLYGDKDCFRLAWLQMGADFHFADYPAQIGILEGNPNHPIEMRKFAREFLLHYFEGIPAFVHQLKKSQQDIDLIFNHSSLYVLDMEPDPVSSSPPFYDKAGIPQSEQHLLHRFGIGRPAEQTVMEMIKTWVKFNLVEYVGFAF